MATNRQDYFIEAIETQLGYVDNLNVITKFNYQKWMDYKFPYAFVALSEDDFSHRYENYSQSCTQGVQKFAIWLGIEDYSGGDIRKVFTNINFLVEKAFIDFEIPRLTTNDIQVDPESVLITGNLPVQNFEDTKFLFVVEGEIGYEHNWIADYHSL
jgi:hypothetical protein